MKEILKEILAGIVIFIMFLVLFIAMVDAIPNIQGGENEGIYIDYRWQK